MKAWGVFLDRDGTLVPDSGYMTDPGDLHLFDGVGNALRKLRDAGASLIVVSNQSAVARGLMDDSGLRRMDERLRELIAETGNHLDEAYYCPHHPDFGESCSCRKPSPGMIVRGLEAFGLEAGTCYLVGDTVGDLEAGRAAGVRTVLVLTGLGSRTRPEAEKRNLTDAVAQDLGAAVRWILDDRS